ncbi:RHS repeat-associated core domain-containing protein [Fangia hongkongensis]|nr:RHS repeat-associated core domain-containing protein [Fangia hongkongensis]
MVWLAVLCIFNASYATSAISETSLSLSNDPFFYDAAYQDVETNSIYLRARYFSTSSNHFISQDTLSLFNRYSAFNDNPVSFLDPSGHSAKFFHAKWWHNKKHISSFSFSLLSTAASSLTVYFAPYGGFYFDTLVFAGISQLSSIENASVNNALNNRKYRFQDYFNAHYTTDIAIQAAIGASLAGGAKFINYSIEDFATFKSAFSENDIHSLGTNNIYFTKGSTSGKIGKILSPLLNMEHTGFYIPKGIEIDEFEALGNNFRASHSVGNAELIHYIDFEPVKGGKFIGRTEANPVYGTLVNRANTGFSRAELKTAAESLPDHLKYQMFRPDADKGTYNCNTISKLIFDQIMRQR